jgi:hypothetical protein
MLSWVEDMVMSYLSLDITEFREMLEVWLREQYSHCDGVMNGSVR